MVVEAVEEGGAGVAEEEDGVATAEMTWKLCSNLTMDELLLPLESNSKVLCLFVCIPATS